MLIQRPVPWVFDRAIGHGGMGEVWAARHAVTGAPGAIKVITARRAQEHWVQSALRNEIRAMARLAHPAVVRIQDHGIVPRDSGAPASMAGLPCLVMDRVEGTSLKAQLGRAEWPQVRLLLHRLLGALAHAHARGLVHRDLKPANVLVPTAQGLTGASLTDFGLAHTLDAGRRAEPHDSTTGTPSYMAPEQVIGDWRLFGPPTDLYGLGCTTWALLCGRGPFAGLGDVSAICRAQVRDEPPSFQPLVDVPAGFERWLRWLLEKNPADRPCHAVDAALALDALHRVPGTLSLPALPRYWKTRAAPRPPPGESLFALRALPLVARETEQNHAWFALRRVLQEGRAGALVLHGPAGTGKSHLAAWLCARSQETGATQVLSARHSPLSGARDGLGAMLRRHLGCEDLDPRAIDEHLGRRLSGWALGATGDRAGLVALVSETAEGGSAQARFSSARERHHTLRRVLARLSAERPVVLWLDDAQWGPDALIFAASVLERRDELGPVLVLLTLREGEVSDRPVEAELLDEIIGHEGTTAVPVRALSREGSRALVRELLGLEPVLAARVEARTAGNPLFAVQLIGDWIDRGVLTPGPQGLRVREGADTEMPDDLYQVWATRVEEVLADWPQRVRLGLEVAAVLGQEVDAAEWQALCGLVDAEASGALVETLVERRLAWVGPEGPDVAWSFVHGMLREAVERGSWEAGRAADLHRACAEHLSDPDALATAHREAQHWLAAGLLRQAIAPLKRAITAQFVAGDIRLARDLLQERQRCLDEALVDPADVAWSEQGLHASSLGRLQGDLASSAAICERTLASAREHGWSNLGHVLAEAGDVARHRNRLDEAAALLGEAVAHALAHDDRKALGRARQRLATVMLERGRYTECLEMAQAGREDLFAVDDPVGAAICQLVGALGHVRLGQDREAIAGLLQARREYRETGCRWGVADVCVNLGDLARLQGDFDRAEALTREAQELYEATATGSLHVTRLNLALITLERGDYDGAEPQLQAQVDEYLRLDLPRWAATARAGLILCHAARRRSEQLGDELRLAEGELVDCGFTDPDVASLLERAARAALAGGEDEAAARIARLAVGQGLG